jgi:hypothetical protein
MLKVLYEYDILQEHLFEVRDKNNTMHRYANQLIQHLNTAIE